MPRYTREFVKQKAAELFGKNSVEGVLRILDRYTSESGQERIHLACLILSEGNLDKLKHAVATATKDYRDVLYWTGLPPEGN